MTFLPVVERELRVAARRRRAYFFRAAMALIAVGLTGWVIKMESNYSQSLGHDLFGMLSFLMFVCAGIFGVLVTADCLTVEKREGSLSLLFLTDLMGYDIVFGKLTATSLDFFYGMLAVVPALAIPLLMGGVSQGELLRVVLMLASLLFFPLSIGVWASALCRHTSWAHAVSILVVLTILFAWPLATQLRHNPVSDNRLAYLPSPVYGCFLLFDSNYKFGQRFDFWLRLGFRARKPGRAGAAALAWVQVLPVFLFYMPGYWILRSARNGWSVLIFWCLLGLGMDLIAIYFHYELLSEFRLIASEGYKRKPPTTPFFNAAPALAKIS